MAVRRGAVEKLQDQGSAESGVSSRGVQPHQQLPEGQPDHRFQQRHIRPGYYCAGSADHAVRDEVFLLMGKSFGARHLISCTEKLGAWPRITFTKRQRSDPYLKPTSL